jgi:multiple sugar transport system substrate-binding protein
MLKMVKQFNRQNPDVHVLMQRMDWSIYYNKLFVAGIGERAPELFVIHVDSMERFYRTGFIRPLDDLIAATPQFNPGDFQDFIWRGVRKEGKVYGVPLDVNLVGMYYNKTLFRRAGIVDQEGQAKPPVTREEFLTDLGKIQALNQSPGHLGVWGFAFTSWYRISAATLIRQFDGQYFNRDLTHCTLDDPRNVAAMDFCLDLVKNRKVAAPPENFNSWIGFRQGRIGIVFDGIWMLPDLMKQTDLDFGGAPVPLLGTRWSDYANGHVLCMSNNLDEKHRQAVWRFMQYLSSNSLQWAEGGQIPARRSLLASERFKKMTVQSEFAKQLGYAELLPSIPFMSEFATEFDLALEKALHGVIPPRQAFAEASARVDQVIERRRQMAADSSAQR